MAGRYDAAAAKQKKIEEEAKRLAEKMTAPIISEYKEKVGQLEQREQKLNEREADIQSREGSGIRTSR